MGEPIQAGKFTVYPVSKAAAVLPEGNSGGLIWNRPHAVLVRGPNGKESILPIRDVTRERQLLLLGLGLLGVILLRMINRKR